MSAWSTWAIYLRFHIEERLTDWPDTPKTFPLELNKQIWAAISTITFQTPIYTTLTPQQCQSGASRETYHRVSRPWPEESGHGKGRGGAAGKLSLVTRREPVIQQQPWHCTASELPSLPRTLARQLFSNSLLVQNSHRSLEMNLYEVTQGVGGACWCVTVCHFFPSFIQYFFKSVIIKVP